ncbi:MAG: hypothetical protein MZV70_00035 [Desulfobacterales bacterium]|nr:hypothetical protein [Desulfobacterales bacterium]
MTAKTALPEPIPAPAPLSARLPHPAHRPVRRSDARTDSRRPQRPQRPTLRAARSQPRRPGLPHAHRGPRPVSLPPGSFNGTAAGGPNARGQAHVVQLARVKRLKPSRRGGILVCGESVGHAIGPSSVEMRRLAAVLFDLSAFSCFS